MNTIIQKDNRNKFYNDAHAYSLNFLSVDKIETPFDDFRVTCCGTKRPNNTEIIIFNTQLTNIEKEIIKRKTIQRFDL